MAGITQLGGRTRSQPGAQAEKPGSDLVLDNAALAALQGTIDRLTAACVKSDADLSAARADATTERGRVEAIRALLIEETAAGAAVKAELAGVHAEAEGVRAQLETVRAGAVALQQRLAEAIAAAAVPHQTHVQAGQPVAYEMVVGERDSNNRVRTVSLKPVAG